MKRLSLILFVLLAQLAFSQKYPIHYKIVYNLENNHDVSQRTYYVTIHQAKLKKDKTNELEMHIVGLEDYDPHGKTFRYSSFKLNEANEYLRSSTNFFNLLSHYFPLQFSIAEECIIRRICTQYPAVNPGAKEANISAIPAYMHPKTA